MRMLRCLIHGLLQTRTVLPCFCVCVFFGFDFRRGGGEGMDFKRGFLFPKSLLSSLTFHFVYLNVRRCSLRESKSSL